MSPEQRAESSLHEQRARVKGGMEIKSEKADCVHSECCLTGQPPPVYTLAMDISSPRMETGQCLLGIVTCSPFALARLR